ncbi:uncharacterized protein [Drosophila kikkawai]|uniref:Uncharacterized protein n=1 Tax=Drosophila kikkawai TaxID=30033 RepID=A0ABM4GKZ7_DROKI
MRETESEHTIERKATPENWHAPTGESEREADAPKCKSNGKLPARPKIWQSRMAGFTFAEATKTDRRASGRRSSFSTKPNGSVFTRRSFLRPTSVEKCILTVTISFIPETSQEVVLEVPSDRDGSQWSAEKFSRRPRRHFFWKRRRRGRGGSSSHRQTCVCAEKTVTETMASDNPSRLWRAVTSAAATVEVSRTDDVVLGYPAEGEPSPGKTGPQAGVLPEDIDWEAFSEAMEYADEILAGRRSLPDLHRAVSHAGAAAAVPNRVPVARRRVVFASAVGTPRSPTPEENHHGRPDGSSDSNDVVATGPRSKGSDGGTADDDGSQEDDDVIPIRARHRRASSMSDFDAADVARRTTRSLDGAVRRGLPRQGPPRAS